MSSKPKVTYVICYQAGLLRGGLEIQAEKTMRALEALGTIQIEMFTPCTNNFGDIVHFFGNYEYFWDIARFCVDAGVPYVCSPVFLSDKEGLSLRWKAVRKRYLEQSYPKNLSRLYHNAQRLFTLTKLEEEKLNTFFGTRLPKMTRVPNGVDKRFFDATPDLFLREKGIKSPFVLHSGSMEARKNQHRLIEAARDLDIDVVLMGREPEKDYLAVCRAAAGSNVHFLGELPSESPLIASANAAASVFCLPSFAEVLSLSALEAAVTGAPLILGNTWGAEEYFGQYAKYVDPSSVSEIRKAIQSSLTDPPDRHKQREYFVARFSWDSIARQILAEYQAILNP